jgi:hypothetical protein
MSTGAAPVSAASPRTGELHATKDCSTYFGRPNDYCTITSSSLDVIKVGSKIYYDQAAGIPTGLLDSNVVLDAGNGDRAMGRCTVEFSDNHGLCTFSDGTGHFAGFRARVNVTPFTASPTNVDYRWDGEYSLNPE